MTKLCRVLELVMCACAIMFYGQASMAQAPQIQKPTMVTAHTGTASGVSATSAGANASASTSTSTTSASAPQFLVGQSCKYCKPLSKIGLWFVDLQASADPVLVGIQGSYYGWGQSVIRRLDIGAMGAYESGPGYFSTIPWFSTKRISTYEFQNGEYGRYDFVVTFYDLSTGGFIQSTRLTAYYLFAPTAGEVGPIVIDHVVVSASPEGYQVFSIYGKFPKNQPMDLFFGILGYEGSFTTAPSLVSLDGQSIVTYGIGSVSGVHLFRGDITLEAGDGTFSTILESAFSF